MTKLDFVLFCVALVLGTILIIVVTTMARALSLDEILCYTSAQDVHHYHPRAWPRYTRRAPGHKGEKCWYPGDFRLPKKEPQVRITKSAPSPPLVELLPVPPPNYGFSESDLQAYAARRRLIEEFNRWRIFREIDEALGLWHRP